MGEQKGILTAAHVLTALPNSGDIAIALCAEGPSMYRATKLNIGHTSRVVLAGKQFGATGPDIAFLSIPDLDAKNLEALSGVFYNLSTRADQVLSSDPPSPDSLDVTVGVIDERTTVLPVTGGKTQVTQFAAFFCAGKTGNNCEDSEGYDLTEFEVTDASDFPLPSSFAGTSGGSLWRFYLAMKEGKPAVVAKRLIGVPFYQTQSASGKRLLICHGPRSIYDKLLRAVLEKSGH